MNNSACLRKTINLTLIGCMLSLSIQAPVMARMIDNNQIAVTAEVQQQRDEVKVFLARDDVKSTLLAYGVDGADVDKRVNQMTDSEVSQIHDQLSQLPAGGDALGAVLTVLLILILLEVLGVINIFSRI